MSDDKRYMNVRVSSEITELLMADTADNMSMPGNYVPAVRVVIRTKDGRAYSGNIYFEDLIKQLNKVKTVSGAKLLKEFKIDA